jgi:hypothetical protein
MESACFVSLSLSVTVDAAEEDTGEMVGATVGMGVLVSTTVLSLTTIPGFDDDPPSS